MSTDTHRDRHRDRHRHRDGGRLEEGNDEPKVVAVLATLRLLLLQLQRRSPQRWTGTA